ncbi:uncharacterized protein [Nicotiana tomentosiformis]|uniref:uncharacterized protein n=1 Tax=Nicotiana tomentosiformis TaxID=4098 RepID=UPI00388CCA9F
MLYSAPTEKSGLIVSHEQTKAFTSNKDHLHCDYCGKSRHTKETCWKLHGRPTRGRAAKHVGLSTGQVNIAENVETFRETASGETLSSEEVQHLRCLLNKVYTSNVGTFNYVQSGIAFNAHLNSWIIDFGANRHMTGFSKGFQNYSPSPKGDCVRIANGYLTPVYGTGYVICTPDITLLSVLHVPEFSVNLLFVSAITKKLNCSIEFFPDYYIFQDLQTRKRIGSGRLHDDLYWIDGTRDFGQAFFGGNKNSPLEALKGKNDYIVPPKVFGYVFFVHTRSSGKLDPRAIKCVFIRKKRVEEAIMQSAEAESSSVVETSSTSELSKFSSDLDVPIANRKGVRSCTKHPLSNFVSYNSLSPSYRAFALSISSMSIPLNWREAFADPK